MSVDTLLTERAVEQVLNRYATALDTRDWPLLASCFTEDAVVTYAFGPVTGRDDIIATCRGALEPLDASQHLLGNVTIEVDGSSARATCYFQAQHVRGGTEGGDWFLLGGRYVDELVRQSGEWRIATRSLERQWSTGNPAALQVPGRD